MIWRTLVIGALLFITGCEETLIPTFDGMWHGDGGLAFQVEVTERNNGEIIGKGRLESFHFRVQGLHSYPDVSFAGTREGAPFLVFEGRFTDDATVEGTLQRRSASQQLILMRQ